MTFESPSACGNSIRAGRLTASWRALTTARSLPFFFEWSKPSPSKKANRAG